MRNLFLTTAIVLALAGCSATTSVTPTTVSAGVSAGVATVQVDQAKIASAVTGACGDATAAASLAAPFSAIPQVAGVLTFITAGCGTADAVAALTTKAVNDPSTIAWAEGLAAQVQSAVTAVKAL